MTMSAKNSHADKGEKERMLNGQAEGDDAGAAVSKMMTSSSYEPTDEDRAYKGWKHLIPFRAGSKNPKTLPLISAGPLNFATCHWVNGLIFKAYKSGVTQDDLFDTPWRDSAGYNSQRFEKLWNEELAKHGKKNASVARTIMRMIRMRLIWAVALTFLFSAFAILGPAFFLRNVLDNIRDEREHWIKLSSTVMLAVCVVMASMLFSTAFALIYLPGVRVRGGVLSFVFKKILSQQIQNKSVGELVNLCANDGQRLFDACMMGVFAISGLASVAGAAYAIFLLGPWGILGFVVFFLFLPVQVLLSKVIFNLRSKAVPVTDERVKLMSEIVMAIKLVKMYAWEKSFAKKINDIREREKSILTKSLMVQSLSSVLPQTVPLFASALSFIAMTSTGADLTATQAFVFISLLNSLRFTLGIMPHSMKALAEGRHACDRMKAILIADDEKIEMSDLKNTNNIVEIRGGCFGWDPQPETETDKKSGSSGKPVDNGNSKTKADANGNVKTNGVTQHKSELQPLADDGKRGEVIVTLKDIDMSLNEGMLLGVCGAVGSGKTSIIQAILCMMKKTGGEIAINRDKNLAYVPQQAWIMNTTVRENIIFGHEFEQERYDKVVEACALKSDFDQLAAGDQTEIGERGINLSGGQKQRISMARAVYSDSDLILLDDPLSAVDAHVGEHIFRNCLKGFLKGKTILFVTHQLQFLTGCDYILVMKEGRINEEGTHEVLMSHKNGEYCNLIKSFHDAEEEEKAKDFDVTSVADSFFSRQQSKLSVGDDSRLNASHERIAHTSNPRMRGGSVASQIKRMKQQKDSNSNTTVSHSTHDLSRSFLDIGPDEEFRKRALSMHSMKSARHAVSRALSEAKSNRMLDTTMTDALAIGSMLDVTSVADLEVDVNGDEADIVARQAAGKLTKAEEMEQGSVKLSTYRSYMNAAGGPCVILLVGLLVMMSVSSQAFSNYWLSIWINDGSGGYMENKTEEGSSNFTLVLSDSLLYNSQLDFFKTIYGCSLIVVVIFTVVKSITYMKTCLRASSRLHDKVFRKLVSSPMSFFDVTPSGQIMNRFSKDMDEIDINLPFLSEQFLNNSCVMLVTVIIIATVFYYFLLAMIPIVVIFVLLYKICQRGIRSMKRIDNVTRSPLFSHVTTTVQGLGTIRAYKKEEQFLIQFNKLQDRNNMALFLFHSSMRWAAVRLDTLSLLVVFSTSLFVAFMPSDIISPTFAALALSYAMNMTGLFQYTMRLAIETEARFTSVERIQTYVDNLDSEAPAIVEGKRPDDSWPREGAIQFNNVNIRYREGLPLVLKNVSLKIKAQEKIGIVGRTGSGKSSMGMALFRMMELAGGTITIDGVDISTIGLEDLRSKLSIIPQDPVLFVGTVRYNLDPFHAYTDDELWTALSKCHVKRTIKALEGQLDATIVENGENFSVGERQLLCMARALLRHSKILLLDEATAAIDTETDSLIQQTIKEAFVDCTMLTIAHRLNTVASSDRILVLDGGEVIEFDTPAKLLATTESAFAQMMAVQESQKQAAMESGGNTT